MGLREAELKQGVEPLTSWDPWLVLKVKSLKLYLLSLPVKESEIIGFSLGKSLKSEVLKILPEQKWLQLARGPDLRLLSLLGTTMLPLVLVVSSPGGGHCHRGAIILAKLSITPVQRDYWGGTDIVSAPVPKKLLRMAGVDDSLHISQRLRYTLVNLTKATFEAISKTYSNLTPDYWKESVFTKSPY
ncbi:40S ribosomal protein S2-like [Rattus rattus]|uniref:40S ribosomal protein S2-like n=1 Tax=Rattus rattus TaxID=10117 RepID=UPI0013F316C1|nr:40S ribosomal protein S2-like [Rattus rattus]